MQFLFILAIVAIVVVGLVLSHRAELARRQALRDLADRRNWTFDAERDKGHDERFAHFDVFRRGHSRYAYNTLRGKLDAAGTALRAQAGDFHYAQGSGKNRRTYRFTYLILHLPFATPALQVRREGLFDKLAAAIGFDDIDFESAEFSRRFFVKGPDQRFAYALLDPRMMEFLLRGEPPGLELENGQLCLADARRWSPERIAEVIEFARGFLAQWPSHLVKELESLHG